MSSPSARADLRSQLEHGFVLAPAVHNALFAKLVEDAGFDCVAMTGAGTAARYGSAEVGLLTATEVLSNVRAICSATRLPVLADAGTGYGSDVHVARTTRQWERAGAAALHLGDEVFPHSRGVLGPTPVVPLDEALARLRAALDARQDGLVVVARTSALGVHGWEDVVARAAAFRDAGADLVLVDGVRTRDDLETYAGELAGTGVPCVYDGTLADPAEVERLGFKVHLLSGLVLATVFDAATQAMAALRDDGTITEVVHRYDPSLEARGIKEILADVGGINELLGLPAVYEFEQRYATGAEPAR